MKAGAKIQEPAIAATVYGVGCGLAWGQPKAGAVSDVRLRNLAVLKTSTINDCHY